MCIFKTMLPPVMWSIWIIIESDFFRNQTISLKTYWKVKKHFSKDQKILAACFNFCSNNSNDLTVFPALTSPALLISPQFVCPRRSYRMILFQTVLCQSQYDGRDLKLHANCTLRYRKKNIKKCIFKVKYIIVFI